MGNPKIVKILPFYGRWPTFMHVYLDSVRRNPLLQVVFVTDLPPFPSSPPNVSYVSMPFTDLKARIASLFGADVSRMAPYKLCDFRPAFGVIFADIVRGTDFWGYGDNDMILGDVSRVLTAQRLQQYDVLSFKQGHLQGPLTFYRNTPVVNELFREGGAFRSVFADARYLSFDEFGPGVFYTGVKRPEDIENFPSDNISVIAIKKALAGELRLYLAQHGKENLRHRDVLAYSEGRVFDVATGIDFLFYHWVLEKRGIWFRYPTWFESRPPTFYISTTGFYSPAEYRWFPIRHAWRLFTGSVRWVTLRLLNYARRRLGLRVTTDTYPRLGWIKRLDDEARQTS